MLYFLYTYVARPLYAASKLSRHTYSTYFATGARSSAPYDDQKRIDWLYIKPYLRAITKQIAAASYIGWYAKFLVSTETMVQRYSARLI